MGDAELMIKARQQSSCFEWEAVEVYALVHSLLNMKDESQNQYDYTIKRFFEDTFVS